MTDQQVTTRTGTIGLAVAAVILAALAWTGLAGTAWHAQGCGTPDAIARAWTAGLPAPHDVCPVTEDWTP